MRVSPSSLSEGSRSRRGWLTAVTAVALAVPALSACSGSSSTAAAGGGGSCSSPGVTSNEVKVAAVAPTTGPSAPTFAGFVEAANARFQQQNDAGGVNGRKITLLTDDDKGDGSQQVVAGRNAIQSQKVFGVLSASRVDTMYDYLKQQSVPVIGYPGQPAYATNRNAFGFSGASSTGYVSTALLNRVKAAGAANLANLAHNSPGSINSAKGYVASAAKVGVKISVSQYDIPLGSFDATSVAIKMKQAGVDSIVAGLLTDSSVSVLKALQAQGVKLKVIYVAGVYDPAVYSQISNLLQGAIISPNGTVPTELNTPATTKYVAQMKQYAPNTSPNAGFATPGYVSADLFIKGLQLAGNCVSRSNFIDKLRGLTGYDADGLLVKPAVFAPAELPDGTPYTKCSWYASFQGSKWVPDPQATCGDLIKFS
jgi:branched-chain amino acid transport system substrate-binding protein